MGEVKDLVLTDVEVVDEGEADGEVLDPEDATTQADSIRWHQVALDTCDDI